MNDVTQEDIRRIEGRTNTIKGEVDEIDRRLSKHEGECSAKRDSAQGFKLEARQRMDRIEDSIRRHVETSSRSVQRLEKGFAEMRGEVAGRNRLVGGLVALLTILVGLVELAKLVN